MPRTILVLNVGSSSVKFAVARGRQIIMRGLIDHVSQRARVGWSFRSRRHARTVFIPDLPSALKQVRGIMAEYQLTPDAIAHRIVHGGQRYTQPTKLTPATIKYLRQLNELAPLHQPANLAGVAFGKRYWPSATEWGVFDTAIFRQLPAAARIYALPLGLAKRLHIEKYGFHGTSHQWAFRQAASKLKIPPRKMSAVTIHLGSGSSMTLWDHGRPIDTSLGFTPLSGLVMLTRSGDIDPAIPLFLQSKMRWPAPRVQQMLEYESGLVGLCGLHDMRDILVAVGQPVANWPHRHFSSAIRNRAKLALKVYVFRIQRELAGFLGLISRASAVIFTGPIGEKHYLQQLIISGLPAVRGIPRVTIHADEEQAMVEAINA